MDIAVLVNWILGVFLFAGACTIFFTNKNYWFQIFEYAFSSTITGYLAALMVKQILDNAWAPLKTGKYWYIIPILLGIMAYTRYIPRYSFIARFPTALLMGGLIGVVSRAALDADIIRQIIPLVAAPNNLNVITMQIVTIITMFYFVFTIGTKETGGLGSLLYYIRYLGRLFIMVAMGAAFSNKYLGLMASMINRVNLILFGLFA